MRILLQHLTSHAAYERSGEAARREAPLYYSTFVPPLLSLSRLSRCVSSYLCLCVSVAPLPHAISLSPCLSPPSAALQSLRAQGPPFRKISPSPPRPEEMVPPLHAIDAAPAVAKYMTDITAKSFSGSRNRSAILQALSQHRCLSVVQQTRPMSRKAVAALVVL